MIFSNFLLAVFVVVAVGMIIVIPCALLVLGVTLAFRHLIEERLGDSWDTKEFSGTRNGGGRIVVCGNESLRYFCWLNGFIGGFICCWVLWLNNYV